MALKTSEVLRKAGDVLRERGWAQGRLVNSYGEVCAIGALQIAEHGFLAKEGDELVAALRLPLGDGMAVSIWNDHPARSRAEVEQLFDAAYVLALQEEGEDDLTDYEEL